MPHPSVGFPIPPFEWPHVGRQWPAYNVESDQAEGLAIWMPWGGGYPGSHQHVDQVKGLTFTEGGMPTWRFDGERGWSMLFDDAASEYLSLAQAIVTAVPFTITARARSDDAVSVQAVFAISDVSDWGDRFAVVFDGNNIGDPIRFTADDAGGVSYAYTTTGYSVNTWHHIAAVAAAANDRSVFIDGGSKGVNTDTRTPPNLDRTTIGCWERPTNAYFFSGCITDVRVYNVAKTDTEVYQMYANPWELHQLPRRLWRLGVVTPPPPTAALPIFPPPDAVHSLVFGGVTVR